MFDFGFSIPDELVCGQSMGTQTESDDIIFCYECEFPADDYFEFGEHMMEFHSETSCKTCGESFHTKEMLTDHKQEEHTEECITQRDNSMSIHCNFCESIFQRKDDLMKHKKEEHAEKVKICWKLGQVTIMSQPG